MAGASPTDVKTDTPPNDTPPSDPPVAKDAPDGKPPEAPAATPEPTKKDDATVAYEKALVDGRSRERKDIAKALGVDLNDLDSIKDAIKFKGESVEAAKSLEEKLAASKASHESASKENESLRDMAKLVVDRDMKDLPKEAKALVEAQAGDNVIEQFKLMSTKAFKDMVAKMGGATGSPGASTGGEPAGGTNSSLSAGQKLFDEARKGDFSARQAYENWEAANIKLSEQIKIS